MCVTGSFSCCTTQLHYTQTDITDVFLQEFLLENSWFHQRQQIVLVPNHQSGPRPWHYHHRIWQLERCISFTPDLTELKPSKKLKFFLISLQYFPKSCFGWFFLFVFLGGGVYEHGYENILWVAIYVMRRYSTHSKVEDVRGLIIVQFGFGVFLTKIKIVFNSF